MSTVNKIRTVKIDIEIDPNGEFIEKNFLAPLLWQPSLISHSDRCRERTEIRIICKLDVTQGCREKHALCILGMPPELQRAVWACHFVGKAPVLGIFRQFFTRVSSERTKVNGKAGLEGILQSKGWDALRSFKSI
ncbi:hypothetical protein TNCV_1887221 [Trichonephila clavipes]|nr:hypothetical protein TNCV_1887221 [Trichonephila clavipes]